MNHHIDAFARDSADIHFMSLHEANLPASVTHNVDEDLSSDLLDDE